MNYRFLLFFLLPVAALAQHAARLTANEDTTQLFIPVEIDGHTYTFLFDTGAEKSLLFTTREENTEKLTQIPLYDAENRLAKAYVSTPKTVTVPGLSVKVKTVLILLGEQPAQLKKYGVMGILGADVINVYDWEVSIAGLQARILGKKDKKAVRSEFFTIPVSVSPLEITARLQFDRGIQAFRVDLGYTQIASMTDSLWTNEDAAFTKYALNYSVSGTQTDTLHVVQADVRLSDGFSIGKLPVTYASGNKMNLLGLSFFKPFGKLWLLNSEQKILVPQIDHYDYKAMAIVEKDGVVVAQIVGPGLPEILVVGSKTTEIENGEALKKQSVPLARTTYGK